MMLTSKGNNKLLKSLVDKLLEIVDDRSVIGSCLLSPLSKFTNPEITSRFKSVRDSNSKRVGDFLLHNIIPVNISDNLLKFRERGKIFEFKGDLLKMISSENYSVDLASLSDKKMKYDFEKDLYFDVKAPGDKSTRDCTLIRLLNSPGIKFSASDVSKEIFLKNKNFII